jgi:hypothetical protein
MENDRKREFGWVCTRDFNFFWFKVTMENLSYPLDKILIISVRRKFLIIILKYYHTRKNNVDNDYKNEEKDRNVDTC